MKIKVVLFTVLFICFSCDSKFVYNEFDSDFENNRWLPENSRTFNFAIEKEVEASIVLHLGHIYDFQFDSILLQTAITYPDGHTEIESIDLKIKDSNGNDIAECSGDICDLYFTLKEKEMLQKGNYMIVVSNKFNPPYIPNILGVGIQVK